VKILTKRAPDIARKNSLVVCAGASLSGILSDETREAARRPRAQIIRTMREATVNETLLV